MSGCYDKNTQTMQPMGKKGFFSLIVPGYRDHHNVAAWRQEREVANKTASAVRKQRGMHCGTQLAFAFSFSQRKDLSP